MTEGPDVTAEQTMSGSSAPATDADDLLTLAEAVDFLGTSKPTMYRWLERGEVKGLKVGKQWRFRKADLVAYLERGPVALVAAPAAELDAESTFFAAELERVGATPVPLEEEAGSGEEKIDLLARQIITLAISEGASDIHLEPVRHESEAYLLLRNRIDGRLHEIRRMPISLHEALTLHLKRAAGLDLNERRLPQSGSIHISQAGHLYDLRAACLPTLFGEGIVMRILDRTASSILGLEKLGIYPEEMEKLQRLLRQPNGLLLAAGPVGSGRSALLYSSIQALAAPDRKVFILDEYIEHVLPYTTPVRFDKRSGLTMSMAVRALMWNDLDVALIGKIPDLETAQIMQTMALTGHLVLAAVQANNAAGAAKRFIDIGVDPHILSATLIGVVSMRLARRICLNCKMPYDAQWSEPVLDHWRTLAAMGGYEAPEDAPLYRGRGCELCRNSGYKGRIGLYEILQVNEVFCKAIMRGASVDELTEIAVENGMRTLVADGMRKAVEGQTTIDEVRRSTAVSW